MAFRLLNCADERRRHLAIAEVQGVFYKLIDRRAALCESTREWVEWFRVADRVVAKTQIDDVVISTMFLSIDHNHVGVGDPLLLETMTSIAGEGDLGTMRRYFIWEKAEAGHTELVQLVRFEMKTARLKAAAACSTLLQRFKTA